MTGYTLEGPSLAARKFLMQAGRRKYGNLDDDAAEDKGKKILQRIISKRVQKQSQNRVLGYLYHLFNIIQEIPIHESELLEKLKGYGFVDNNRSGMILLNASVGACLESYGGWVPDHYPTANILHRLEDAAGNRSYQVFAYH